MKKITGTIPACAGQSNSMNRAAMRGGDHPRVCGAKLWSPKGAPEVEGPSPRVRGKALEKTSSVATKRDHPRVCGAKAIRPTPGV